METKGKSLFTLPTLRSDTATKCLSPNCHTSKKLTLTCHQSCGWHIKSCSVSPAHAVKSNDTHTHFRSRSRRQPGCPQ